MGYTGEKKREYQRQWLAARRATFFADKSCVRCGSTDRLELDHIDPSLKDSRLRQGTRLWSWSKAKQEAEIAKCQVLCHDCHQDKTQQSNNYRGEKVKTSKLTNNQVAEARNLYATGNYSFRQIGDMYGVHRDTIRYLVNRGGWRHIQN